MGNLKGTSTNIIYGTSGNDTLDGGAGAQTMIGGAGDDAYYVDNTGDVITENSGEGDDTVISSITYTLTANVENLYLDGTDNINGTGNELDNTIAGNSADNALYGLAGSDTLYGGAGNDSLYGGADNDVLNGGDGNDTLDGGAGVDVMVGGAGDDTYYVDNKKDSVMESTSEGTDTVISSITYTLAANIENLTLTGTDTLSGTGNSLDNVVTGNSAANVLSGGVGNDTLYGLAGNDTLDGGAGADSMVGGIGDDTYYVDDAGDVVTENSGEGTDTVISSISAYTLAANIENLTLTGTDTLSGTGNELDNVITGNSAANALYGLAGNDTLYGLAGNDTLDGGTGADSMVGGTGDDTYYVDDAGDVVTENSGEGTDIVYSSVTYTLGDNVENLTLLTADDLIDGTGNALDNVITGNGEDNILSGLAGSDTLYGGAGNDKLDGGTGADSMVGGTGNDTYYVDNTGDVIVENASEGTDVVLTTVTYTLAANVENLYLQGTDAINGTGNALDNYIGGNDAANALYGLAGNDMLSSSGGDDTIDGGTGADIMIGGTGNDTYYVDNTGDVVREDSGEGTDIVYSSVTYTLGDNVENLTLLTADDLIDGTGNALDNVITGNSAANKLYGLAGNDTLYGGAGADTMYGGTGNDLLDGGTGNDVLDGGAGADTMIGGTGNDTYYVDNSGDVITENSGEGTDIVYSAVTYTLAANVENLVLSGTSSINGTGNASANIIKGNSADNALYGLAGNDKLYGYAGNDTLDGGSGADTMIGGTGNDIYYVDNTGDVITENSGEGTDTVIASANYTLGDNVENLALTGSSAINGTGNALNNYITGNSAANALYGLAGDDTLYGLAGDDTLDGGTGADVMVGGTGNDTYYVDDSGDVVSENTGTGNDTVVTSLTAYTLGSNLENLTFTATGAISGTGNELDNIIIAGTSSSSATLYGLAGNDTLYGGAGNDTLDGGAGADSMIGGTGDDTYYVDDSGDVITENSGEGTDTVYSIASSYTLGDNVENLTLTGTAAISGTGNALNNVITGNDAANTLYGGAGIDTLYGGAGNDTLDGGTGADSMIGGTGDDTYVVDDAGDVIIENAGEGTDTVMISTSYTLGDNIENLTLTGTDAINGTGNAVDNVITGNSAANALYGLAGNDTLYGGAGYDTLDGGIGADSMIGGIGDDTYYVDNTGDVVTEYAGEGSDTVISSITYTLSDYIENLTLSGSSALSGTGNAVDNVITGNSAANTLYGLAGNDIMFGGAGNDSLYGGEGADTLYGGAGNDILTGGAGADTMYGGAGNDTYYVDDTSDVVTEYASDGTDTVMTSASYTLTSNVENLTLTGSAVINGTGNELDNTITGNSAANKLYGGVGNDTLYGGAGYDSLWGDEGNDVLYGGTGNDYLDGGTGADTMYGGVGNDTYYVDNTGDVVTEYAGEGSDLVKSTITYTLGNYVENLSLTGTAAINGTGNDLANVITGNKAANALYGGAGNDTLYGLAGNDTLDGGAGADSMVGGTGNDTYYVDNTGDVIVENSGEGTDTVMSSASYTLGDNIENLTLTGSSAINGTGNAVDNVITGNSAANALYGLAGNDTLYGGAGYDTLDGGIGADSMIGGIGDDTYYVDNTGDVVSENAGEGSDTVISSITYTLGSNIENLTLTGSSALSGTGNALDNVITGNSADNALYGLAGNDIMFGGAGNDSLYGGEGGDILYGGTGNDYLDGGAGVDTMYGGAGNDTYYVDDTSDVVTEYASDGIDTVMISASYTLGDNLENLTLTGSSAINGTGNDLDNVITGNSAANALYGGAGADTIYGGAGNDTLYGGAGNDVLYGGDGIDSLLGGAGNDILYGGSSTDVLDGGTGADTMIGGTGNDTYRVDNAGDVITENADEGTDRVESSITYTLAANVENLALSGSSALSGTGNELDNVITGNTAANALYGLAGNDTLYGGAGNDTLDGGAGVDSMSGGIGDDTYYVDNTGDVVSETSGQGTDTVVSTISYTLGNYVENLTLTGSSALSGTGNDLDNVITGNSAANKLYGLAGNDTLDGGAGADSMVGGTGNDTYYVDDAGDVVTENSGEGTDIVYSSVTYTLGDNVENLTLLTADDLIDGTGNALDNVITGNGEDNILSGLAGSDTLYGGAGNDNLDGGTGADSMVGGTGNDTYYVDNTGDVIVENASEGTDVVLTTVTYTLAANVENLYLQGTDAINGTGNALDNYIGGNDAANALYGLAGNDMLSSSGGDDTIDGGTGADIMIGGTGNDTYYVDNTGDVVREDSGEGTDIVYSSVTYTLGDNVENLTLTGSSAINGTGNALDNVITGNSAANKLYGLAGNDTIYGGAGADSMVGGTGNDTYYVDNTGDVVKENSGEGTDIVYSSVTYTLGDNVENLTLTGDDVIDGTGNALDNIITGNSAANTLYGYAGNDTLYGGAGADSMVGGTGNDTYYVDNSGDVITENSGEGTDTVLSSFTYALDANVENLTLIENAGDINGTGNGLGNYIIGNSGDNVLSGLAGNDTLYGGAGNDTLDGGAGADSMIGGSGDDTYHVDNTGDVVYENSGEGTDTVKSSITYTLTDNVENLTLYGTDAINGTGNSLDNVITGNDTDNTLYGGTGNDTLYGGAGNDTYVFSSGAGNDTVTDAGADSSTQDEILFDSTVGKSTVAFFQSGDDLLIGYGSDTVVVKNEFTTTYGVETIQLDNGQYLTSSDISQLIETINAFATNNGITLTSVSDVMNNQELMTIISNSWHS